MGKHTKGFSSNLKSQTKYENIDLNVSTAKSYKKRKRNRWLLRGYVSRHVIFEHQLLRGKEKFPRTTHMTLKEAFYVNKTCETAFLKRLKTDENTHLWKYVLADRRTTQTLIKQFYDRFDCTWANDTNELRKWLEEQGQTLKEISNE